MKLSKEEFDPKALDVDVEKSTFKRYRGEIPPNGTILIFRVTRMWWTQSKSGDSQIYLMAFAEQNTGKLKQYNGLPVREYLTFIPEAAFRYQNFLQNFGLTTRDIFNKMDVEAEPDSIGDIINSIGGWVVGSDDALCRIAVIRDRYDPDELKAKVDRDGWLPLDEDDEVDDADDDEDDEEDEEQPARPARRSRTTQAPARGAKAASARSRRTEPEPEEDDEDYDDEDEDDIDAEAEEAEEEDQEDDDEAEDEPPARTRRAAKGGRTTRSAASATRPAATGRRASERTRTSRTSTARTDRTVGPRGSKGRDGGSREDPPF
jgi:hypothetical protein